MMLKSHKILYLIGSVLWSILIFVGCSLPGRDVPKVHVFDHFDKIVHFTFFLIFHFLWIGFLGTAKNKHLILILISGIYGFFLEFYQVAYVEGRSFDVWDGIADICGALACTFLMLRNRLKM